MNPSNLIKLGDGLVSVNVIICEDGTGRRMPILAFADLDTPHEIGEGLPLDNVDSAHTVILVPNIKTLNVLKEALLAVEILLLKEEVLLLEG